MNKLEWDALVDKQLEELSYGEAHKLREFFDELYNDKRENGEIEEDIIKGFGDPKDIQMLMEDLTTEKSSKSLDCDGYDSTFVSDSVGVDVELITKTKNDETKQFTIDNEFCDTNCTSVNTDAHVKKEQQINDKVSNSYVKKIISFIKTYPVWFALIVVVLVPAFWGIVGAVLAIGATIFIVCLSVIILIYLIVIVGYALIVGSLYGLALSITAFYTSVGAGLAQVGIALVLLSLGILISIQTKSVTRLSIKFTKWCVKIIKDSLKAIVSPFKLQKKDNIKDSYNSNDYQNKQEDKSTNNINRAEAVK